LLALASEPVRGDDWRTDFEALPLWGCVVLTTDWEVAAPSSPLIILPVWLPPVPDCLLPDLLPEAPSALRVAEPAWLLFFLEEVVDPVEDFFGGMAY